MSNTNKIMSEKIRKIVDSNYLQSDELENYLSESKQHHVVLSDYVAMDAYKGNTLKSITRSMSILQKYPKQVIILKDTLKVCGLKGKRSRLQQRMIDANQTRSFNEFCKDLDKATIGNELFREHISKLGEVANSHMDRILSDASKLEPRLLEVEKSFSEEDIQSIRKGQPFTEELCEKFVANILWFSAFLLRDHPKVKNRPKASELRNLLIFRWAICIELLILDWISDGSQSGIKPKNWRNDLVDTVHAAYATFFDGLLTSDKKLMNIYQNSLIVLENCFPENQ